MKNILLIVDPQNDFITGSLAVEGAKEKMMKLAEYINGDHPSYDYVCVTMDTHPEDHCSFKENGGIWPTHCVEGTWGAEIPNSMLNIGEWDIYSKGQFIHLEEYGAFEEYDDLLSAIKSVL